jgi:hypothetical protein
MAAGCTLELDLCFDIVDFGGRIVVDVLATVRIWASRLGGQREVRRNARRRLVSMFRSHRVDPITRRLGMIYVADPSRSAVSRAGDS